MPAPITNVVPHALAPSDHAISASIRDAYRSVPVTWSYHVACATRPNVCGDGSPWYQPNPNGSFASSAVAVSSWLCMFARTSSAVTASGGSPAAMIASYNSGCARPATS